MESHFPGTKRVAYINAEGTTDTAKLHNTIEEQNLDILLVKGQIEAPDGFEYVEKQQNCAIYAKEEVEMISERPFTAKIEDICYEVASRVEAEDIPVCLFAFSCPRSEVTENDFIAKDGEGSTYNDEECDFIQDNFGAQVLRHYGMFAGCAHKMLVLEFLK